MTDPISPLGPRRRGNPNWGKALQLPPVGPTQFEIQVELLGLNSAKFVDSVELRDWCEHNRNRFYIPEWLLKAWQIEVHISLDWSK